MFGIPFILRKNGNLVIVILAVPYVKSKMDNSVTHSPKIHYPNYFMHLKNISSG